MIGISIAPAPGSGIKELKEDKSVSTGDRKEYTMDFSSQMVTQGLAGSAGKQIAQRLGVSESTATAAIAVAVPLLLSALARNASQPEGAQALHQAVANDHDGSIFDNLLGH